MLEVSELQQLYKRTARLPKTQSRESSGSEVPSERHVRNAKPPQTKVTHQRLAKASDRQTVVCDCSKQLTDDDAEFVVCGLCMKLQHQSCMVRADDVRDGSHSPRCNDCRASEFQCHIAGQEHKIQKLRDAITQKRAEFYDLYTNVLWKHYCDLPNGVASSAVVEATATIYDRGVTVPVRKAPRSWTKEVQAAVESMMDAAGVKAANSIMGWEHRTARSKEELLVAWRELAVWLVHHGAYKARIRELGVLAELLGLEEKGTFWKG